MVSFKNLSLLALAGTAIAAPAIQARQYGGKHVVWHTVVHTAYVTVHPGAQPTPAPLAQTTTVVYEQQPKPTTSKKVVQKPKPSSSSSSSTPVYVAPPKPTPESYAPEPTPEPTPTPEPKKEPEPAPTNSGYMGIVDEWREKLGLSKLAHDDQLEQNALKTCRDGNGQMVHQLNPGSFGQVLAPGGPDDFYHVFVGGWLCEKPNLPGLNGVCSEASQGWYYTSTGHADILTDPKYTKIGCGEVGGIWGCDVGY